MTATEKLAARIAKTNSLLCVGLDSDFDKLPAAVKSEEFPQFAFNKAIIDATHDYVCAYKPNVAFYEARGEQGIHELHMTVEYLQKSYPDIFTICDAKRADIGSTNEGYVKSIFDVLGFDSITLHPYLGSEALQPFLQRADKVSIILCRTSNPGSGELQDFVSDGKPLWEKIAENVSQKWNEHNNCMLVVGATYPEEMAKIRAVVGDMTFLVPGIGAQGGDLEKTMKAGLNSQKMGMMINSSRGIIFASKEADFAERAGVEAKKLMEQINLYR
jgi:orotidine-5'-phosphate decarboxylase